MRSELVLLALSLLILLAYLFEAVARRWRVPAPLLLLVTGAALRIVAPPAQVLPAAWAGPIGLVGTVGLILIVLEAGLDLVITREKRSLIASALGSALGILVASTLAVVALLHAGLGLPPREVLAFAVPLAVVSSAIVLPCVVDLEARMREFLVYEASFSDILGIMLFNTVLYRGAFGMTTVLLFPLEAALMTLVAAAISFGLVVLAGRVGGRVRFSLLLALVVLLYAAGKTLHLSALVVVLIAGIVLNNLQLVPLRLRRFHLPAPELGRLVGELKGFIAEGSFLVRTLFFTLFGYSLDLAALNNARPVAIGLMVIVVLVLVRAVALRFVVHVPVFPGCFLIPRGLVTVLLYYAIPAAQRLDSMGDGILLTVIVGTNVLNSIGVAASPRAEACAPTAPEGGSGAG